MMEKKSSPWLILGVVFLIAAVAGGVYYFAVVADFSDNRSYKNNGDDTIKNEEEAKVEVSAEDAYESAVVGLTEGESFQYTIEASNTMSATFTDNPEQNMEQSMEMTGTGKEDLENNKFYTKQEDTTEGSTTVTEIIIIGDTVYTKKDDGVYMEGQKQGDELVVSEMLVGLTEGNYEVVGTEEINGEDCYQYKLNMDKNSLLDFVEKLGGDGEAQLDTENLSYEGFVVELWVSKSLEKFMKSDIEIQGMTTSVPDVPFANATMEMNMDISLTLSNWGETVEIEAPV